MKVYGYLRVSSDEQSVLNQRVGVENFARSMGWCIDGYITDEGVSGTREPDERHLGELLRDVERGDVIVCSELSRLGRELRMVLNVLKAIERKGARLYTVKENYVLGDGIQSTVLAFGFGLAAQIERDLISARTREALERRRREGVHIGRPKGSRTALERHKYWPRRKEIARVARDGRSLRSMALTLGVNRVSLARWLRRLDALAAQF